MGGYFRIVLILGALVVFLFVLRKLKKTEMSIANSVFWLLFVASLVVVAVFPPIAFFFSDLLGIESPSNFIFLYVIAFLFIKCFTLTVEVSKLGEKVNVLSQEVALKENQALLEQRAINGPVVSESATEVCLTEARMTEEPTR